MAGIPKAEWQARAPAVQRRINGRNRYPNGCDAMSRSAARNEKRMEALRECVRMITASAGGCTTPFPFEAAIWLLEEQEELYGGAIPIYNSVRLAVRPLHPKMGAGACRAVVYARDLSEACSAEVEVELWQKSRPLVLSRCCSLCAHICHPARMAARACAWFACMWVDSLLDRSGSAVPPGTVQLCASTCLPCLVAFFSLPKMCHIFLAGRVRPPQGAAVARALVAADVPHSARPGHAARGHAAQLVPRQLHLLPQRQPERAAPADGARCNSSSSTQILLVAAGRVYNVCCVQVCYCQVDAILVL